MVDTLPDGYEFVHHGRDHWNGVAIVSRVGIDDVRLGFPGVNRPPYDEARLVSARCGDIDVHSLYAPNGRELGHPHYLYKLVWLERLRTVPRPDRPTMLLGDFNVAPVDLDIYDPARWRRRTHASPPERAAIDALVDLGLRDVTREHLPDPGVFSWWSYRPGQFEQNRGLRIDLALCDDVVADRIEAVWIDTAERGDDWPAEKPSDHAPVVVDLAD
jgi:exodeoxyribonuclease-3